MSGWRRLWIVASLLLGVPAGLLAYSIYDEGYAYVTYQVGTTEQSRREFWDKVYAEDNLTHCDWNTARAKPSYGGGYDVSCATKNAFDMALLWAFLPAIVLAAIGLTCRWVYRGFKRPAMDNTN